MAAWTKHVASAASASFSALSAKTGGNKVMSSAAAAAGHGKVKLHLYYDVISPYSWISFETLCRYRSKWNIDLLLKPVFLGGIMNESGNQPPAMVPKKGIYMSHDLKRYREYFGIPINFISNPAETLFQKGSLKTQRFLTAVDMEHPEFTEELSRQLWMRIWNRDEDITTKESLLEASNAAHVPEPIAISSVEKSTSDPVKERLKAYTQEALDQGAFGAPTIVAEVNGQMEMFFGADRFELLAQTLGETWHGPLQGKAKNKL